MFINMVNSINICIPYFSLYFMENDVKYHVILSLIFPLWYLKEQKYFSSEVSLYNPLLRIRR